MTKLITGLHHVTAIASDPQKNINFYTQVLGLRLVKKTINFDAPDVYHFYFGDEVGNPGTLLTFFPFKGARRGRKGAGELTYTAFSISQSGLDYWRERLKSLGIALSDTLERFGQQVLRFDDHDGMGIELVGVENDERNGWSGGSVPSQYAIKGFFGVTLNLRDKTETIALLTDVLNYGLLGEEDQKRYRLGIDGKPGEMVDIVTMDPPFGAIQSAGSVHHLAFRTANATSQLKIQQKLLEYGLQVTEVKDRNYFRSIYFREPGGILFEVATDEPGFMIDETKDHLGENLQLPGWAESNRKGIAERLPKVEVNYSQLWSR
ncbi:MAG: ring-cleaving dioxygenase [Cyclobacteriaceae bacterium]